MLPVLRGPAIPFLLNLGQSVANITDGVWEMSHIRADEGAPSTGKPFWMVSEKPTLGDYLVGRERRQPDGAPVYLDEL
jgi:hypothetical protein